MDQYLEIGFILVACILFAYFVYRIIIRFFWVDIKNLPFDAHTDEGETKK